MRKKPRSFFEGEALETLAKVSACSVFKVIAQMEISTSQNELSLKEECQMSRGASGANFPRSRSNV